MKLFFLFALLITFSSFGQTKFREKVVITGTGVPLNINKVDEESIKSDFKIYKIVNIKTKDSLIISGTQELKSKKSKTLNGVVHESELKRIVRDTVIFGDKKIKKAKRIYLPFEKFNANISVSKDSLLLNFWIIDEEYHDVLKGEELPNPDEKYFTTLKNREYLSFPFSNFEIDALTIPFKYHFGFSKDKVDIDPEFNTNVNISGFIGKRFGKKRYTYDKYSGMKESKFSANIGAFIGLGSQKIDSTMTSLDIKPLDKERNVPVLSYGLGSTVNIKDFNFGIFLGFDKGLGKTASKWNHDGKLWLGFGFGYKLVILGKE